MIQLQLKLCGINFRRGKLFNRYGKFPLVNIDFLFFGVCYWPNCSDALMRKALDGLAQNDKWLIENAPLVRLEKKKVKAKIRAELENEYRDDLNYYEKKVYESGREAQRYKKELRTLKDSTRILNV